MWIFELDFWFLIFFLIFELDFWILFSNFEFFLIFELDFWILFLNFELFLNFRTWLLNFVSGLLKNPTKAYTLVIFCDDRKGLGEASEISQIQERFAVLLQKLMSLSANTGRRNGKNKFPVRIFYEKIIWKFSFFFSKFVFEVFLKVFWNFF